ncbi:MAG: permease [Campylobacterota bacterium]|nr:permease [Campylobacterota bacterium]
MKKRVQFKGLKFLSLVFFTYIVLLFLDNTNAILALDKSINIFYQLIPIFIFIIAITALVNYFLKPKHIIKHLGEDSGIKGIFYALLGGIVSHGPMYAWYGLINELREHGLKDELLIIFFYARAIKIPMLPFMIAIFGITFTIVISLYILIFAVLQGKIVSHLKIR